MNEIPLVDLRIIDTKTRLIDQGYTGQEIEDEVLRLEEQVNTERYRHLGFTYFVNASQQCPASFHAQAAYIARQCLEETYTPAMLHRALANDDEMVDKLVGIANRTHEAFHKGLPDVTRDRMLNVLRFDFEEAERMMILPQEALEEIFTVIYPQKRATTTTPEGLAEQMRWSLYSIFRKSGFLYQYRGDIVKETPQPNT